ncbi:TetR/AcrR family transcriptional regulator C-terminal domain-containing protein [Naasia aerilata]|uniref:TetR family transcriptional regulator n=1 Tax=Naasia aerilata TaxID=1162966 RepID=A0ABN6XP17_9MICO|nr:TetR/AcrR family transcriptional regulator C-terminal domain-containing protein [Naasia aerilata]BDZ46744.1 TetR family transcriptional regulator [Naasia aerilata]
MLIAAVAVADRVGIDGMTMRTLSQDLGVVPMALYKHVANKEDLLDGMVDIVWSEVAAPAQGPDWRSEMRRRSVSLRQALGRHRWANGLMEGRMRPGPANLAAHNAMLGCLRSAGFSFSTAVHTTSALDAYIYGFALQERGLGFETAEESGAVARQKRDLQPPAAMELYPYLIEMVVEMSRGGYDFTVEFETGLDLLLDGVERLRPEWATAGR